MSHEDEMKLSKQAIDKALAKHIKEAIASEKFIDPDEQFAGWLPLTMGDKKVFDFAEIELKAIRDLARVLSVSDEVCVNVIKHYQNHIIGDGITINIMPIDLGSDPAKIADALDDSKIKKMKDNWTAFCKANNFDNRLRDWVKRVHRDGEAFLRIFKNGAEYAGIKVPAVRFIDPFFIKDAQGAPMGIIIDKDAETVKAYHYKTDDQDKTIKAEEIIHDKRNVDIDTLRGFSSFWSIFTNVRRLSKNMVNVSVLTSILSAIALVRKHTGATQSKIDAFLAKNSDGRSRTNSVSGKNQYAQQFNAGSVLDAPTNVEYDFPAHTVQSENYIKVIDKELAMVALAFVLPVEWLKSEEPKTELSHGSPVIKNFQAEQQILFAHVEDLFWRVQDLMGVDSKVRLKYKVEFFGPTLAVGSALDQARVNEIEERSGALSPQTWCAMKGRSWALERANTIKHRLTAQPGEVMPGDSGNTNIDGTQAAAGQGGDGQTKKNGGTKGAGVPQPSKDNGNSNAP